MDAFRVLRTTLLLTLRVSVANEYEGSECGLLTADQRHSGVNGSSLLRDLCLFMVCTEL